MRRARACAVLLALCACHRSGAGAGDSGASGPVEAGPSSQGIFSQPIAAARVRSGTVVVAGLVASRAAVAVTAIGDDGSTRWTVDALSGTSGGPNVELHVFPASDGAAVVYRGRRDDRPITLAVMVDASGHVSGPAFDSGPAACTTDDRLAWLERPSGGTTRVLGVPWGRSTPEELAAIPSERDPALVCGAKTVFALGDGEKDTTLATSPPTPSRAKVVMRDRDFIDEEREHDTFVVGDTLGLVRVGHSGSISVREVGAEIAPWRRLVARLMDADDVVAVDGDPDATTVVFTRDEGDSCDGPSTPSVHAVRLASKGPAEQSFDVAPAACDRELGPFWTGTVVAGFVVAWVERASVRRQGEAPIVGLAYRTITSSGLGELRHVRRPSDEMVDAGCDKDRCYAAALVRPAEAADRQPEAVEIVSYP
jgi:hypothetical protein